jgi:hypothetical protein
LPSPKLLISAIPHAATADRNAVRRPTQPRIDTSRRPSSRRPDRIRFTRMAAGLAPGNERHCPHCRRWHPVMAKHAEGTEYTLRMLYRDCRRASYYAGQIGGSSRHETRHLTGSTGRI